MTYLRPTYALVHEGETLLSVDAAITPPFVIGEDVELHDEQSRESMGWFMVEKIARTIPFRLLTGWERVPLAGQEVTVYLQRRITAAQQENPPHGPSNA